MRVVRLTYTTTGAAGFTNPIPVNYMQPNFNVALGVIPSAAATGLSCKAQITMDDQSIKRQVNWSQTATTVTITDGVQSFGPWSQSLPSQLNPHGLVTGDTVNIEGTLSGQPAGIASFDGNYAVTVVDATHYTITVVPSQTTSGDAHIIEQRWSDSTAIPAATAARLYANVLQPCTAVRFVIAALTTGTVDFMLIQGQD
jgi:hypothetical protein